MPRSRRIFCDQMPAHTTNSSAASSAPLARRASMRSPVERQPDTPRVVRDLDAGPLDFARERRHQPLGRKMAVRGKVHRAGNGHAQVGLDLRRRRRRQHLGGDAEAARVVGGLGLLFETMLGVAQHQHAALGEIELVVPKCRPFSVAIAAREVKIAKNGRRAIDVSLRRRPLELPSPAHEVGAPARLDVERALGIPHPAQSLLHHAGTGQRNDVAWHDHAGVDEGAAVALRASPLDERDPMPFARAIVGHA